MKNLIKWGLIALILTGCPKESAKVSGTKSFIDEEYNLALKSVETGNYENAKKHLENMDGVGFDLRNKNHTDSLKFVTNEKIYNSMDANYQKNLSSLKNKFEKIKNPRKEDFQIFVFNYIKIAEEHTTLLEETSLLLYKNTEKFNPKNPKEFYEISMGRVEGIFNNAMYDAWNIGKRKGLKSKALDDYLDVLIE